MKHKPVSVVDDTRSAVARRLAFGSGAYAAQTAIFVLFQVISVPLFLHYWSDTLYGNWLIFFTIPRYLSFLTLGMQTAVASSMSVKVAQGEAREAAKELWAFGACFGAVLLVAAVAVVVTLAFSPLLEMFHITAFDHRSAVLIGALMVGYAASALMSGVTAAGFNAVGMYARQTSFIAATQALEYTALLTTLIVSRNPVYVALAFFAVRFIMTVVLFAYFIHSTPWGHRPDNTSLKILGPLVRPALAYIGFPVGYVLQNQGVIASAGLYSPRLVVVLNACMTVTNSFYQLFSFVGNAARPEFSRSLGQGRLSDARRLQGFVARSTMMLSGSLAIAIIVAGPAFLRIWTGGRVTPGYLPLAMLTVAALADCVWSACTPVVVSVNRHHSTALTFALSALVACLLSRLLIAPLGITGVGLALLVTGLSATAVAVSGTARVLRTSRTEIWRAFLPVPSKVRHDVRGALSNLRG